MKWYFRKQILLSNQQGLSRTNEPVIVHIVFEDEVVDEDSLFLTDDYLNEIPFQLFDQIKEGNQVKHTKLIFPATVYHLQKTYWLYFNEKALDSGDKTDITGIKQLPTTLPDGVKRLDTGYYILELCRGLADGKASGKWGIRHFEAKAEGKNLIKNNANAIGGFYGPFFTVSNGLINPTSHTTVEVETEVEGPLYCRYRFKGRVPNGLDPNLCNKNFEITWEFFYHSPWIRRQYFVEPYSTIVDKMPVTNKITVGDEFESGPGNLVFNRFGAYGGTYYRAGDLYANILAEYVYELLEIPEADMPKELLTFKEVIGEDIAKVSWDYFWRLFSIKEGILTDEQIKAYAQNILERTYRAVHLSPRHKNIKYGQLINVSEEPDETIFPLNANKTVEINSQTDYAMVWYTSEMVARYQIVQRPHSGWVNWGTNGENEYPELPIGSTVICAYGRFNQWENEADKMENPIVAKAGGTEEVRILTFERRRNSMKGPSIGVIKIGNNGLFDRAAYSNRPPNRSEGGT